MDTAAIFAAAADPAAHWTRTNLGPRTEIHHGCHTYTVELPADGEGQARIVARDGYGGTESLHIEATWPETIAIVDQAQADLRA